MPECPHCERFFEVKFRQCPNCNDFEAPINDFLSYWSKKTEIELETGLALDHAKAWLTQNELTISEAETIIGDSHRIVTQRIRSHSLKRIFFGAIAMLPAAIAGFAFFATAASEGLFIGMLLYFAVATGLFGVAAVISGIRSLMTGRDHQAYLDS